MFLDGVLNEQWVLGIAISCKYWREFRGWMDGPTKGEERVRNGTVDKITHSLAETERILFHEELIRRHTVHVNTLFEILLRQDAS